MTLDRWIAFVFLLFCLIYGYTAFFVMDDQLAPFLKNNPVWPSTFPKVLSVGGIIAVSYTHLTLPTILLV